MSLDIGPDRTDRAGLSQEQSPAQPTPPIDPGLAALQRLTDGTVSRIYGPENAALAGARLEEIGHFDREQAAAVLRDAPEALGPVQNRATAMQLAEALPSIYASTDIARPPITTETLERDGVTYAVEGLDPVRDERGATHLVGESNEQAVTYLDRDRHWPYTIHIRAFHPDAEFMTGYRGDNRDFSTSLDVTSRIQQTIVLGAGTGTDRVRSLRPTSDPSHHDAYPGFMNDVAAQPTGGVTAYSSVQNPYGNETEIFRTHFEGHNRLIPISIDINVNARFTVSEDLPNGKLYVTARFDGDNFPNTEAFITDKSGRSVFIATETLHGNELINLIGHNHNTIMRARLIINIDQGGGFTGVTGPDQQIYSVDAWNDHVRQNPQ